MEIEYVLVNGVPLKVASWGGYMPSKIKANVQKKPDRLILMLPGNPGVIEFYFEFLNRLYTNLNTPIWIVSHGGHDRPDDKALKVPSLKNNEALYKLSGQVSQKIEFVNTYLNGTDLTLIGHSIGCKMIMDMLSKEEHIKCSMNYFFFPTLERMAQTPNGRRLLFSYNYGLVRLAILGSALFCILPNIIKMVLLKVYNYFSSIDSHNEQAMLKLIHPGVLSNVFFLALDEMDVVLDLNLEFIKKFKNKLYLYYSDTDGWTPLYMYNELKQKFDDINAHVTDRKFKHAFVLNSSIEVADFISDLIRST